VPDRITEKDIHDAQAAWADAVVTVGRFRADRAACVRTASDALDRLYAFDETEVLFKPTRAVERPFRHCRAGALSYFVGGDPEFPEDTGFALQPWREVRFENARLRIDEHGAVAMGHYHFTGVDDQVLTVEYTLGYRPSGDGSPRIFLHHSSLPYPA